MPVTIVCPKCEATYSMDMDVAEGRNVRCAYCNFKFPYFASGKPSDEVNTPKSDDSGDDQSGAASAAPKAIIGRVIGDCRVEKKIAQGGMGAVFKAHHVNLDIPVAVKFLPKTFAKASRNNIDQFIMEARSAAKLQHQNIIGVLNVGFEKGLHFIVMQYVDGKNLKEILNEKKRFEPAEALEIISQICLALDMARRHNIVHRDVKLSNIMIDSLEVVKLADLGLAQQLTDESLEEKRNSLIGTPYFMSPEQAKNPRAVDHRADIYSLGCTFFQMVTGELPFKSNDLHELLRMHLEAPIPNPRDIVPEIPKKVSEIIMKMMAKKPEDRYETTLEIKEKIDGLLTQLRKPSTRISKVSANLRSKVSKPSVAKSDDSREKVLKNYENLKTPMTLKIASTVILFLLILNIALAIHMKVNVKPGLKYDVYVGEFRNFINPKKDKLKPYFSGVTSKVALPEDINVNKGVAIIYKGYLNIDGDKEIIFTLSSDDGSILYIDGQKIIDNGGTHSMRSVKRRVRLTAGQHEFYIQYFNLAGGPGELKFEAGAPGTTPVELTGSDFTHKQ